MRFHLTHNLPRGPVFFRSSVRWKVYRHVLLSVHGDRTASASQWSLAVPPPGLCLGPTFDPSLISTDRGVDGVSSVELDPVGPALLPSL